MHLSGNKDRYSMIKQCLIFDQRWISGLLWIPPSFPRQILPMSIFRKLMTSRIIKLNIILGVVLTNLQPVSPQEILIPAIPDVAIISSYVNHKSILKSLELDTLELPFFDDFSINTGNPDGELWTDSYVFINNNYSDNPVSIGVATLDAINNAGMLNGETETPFPSDYLTSMPINLYYPGRNDIYLSFFYQPQGLGDEPEEWDSLIVEFYSPTGNEWRKVWLIGFHYCAVHLFCWCC